LFSEYFKNFSTNELTEYARMPRFLWKYDSQYTEPLPVQNWEISDDTLTVAGYLCQKATCRFRGRDYTAWFTTDIPINNGPWKFGGLPGLILKIYDKDKLYTFECVGIENHKQKYPITLLNAEKQYSKTDRMKLWKLKKTIQEDYYTIRQLTSENGHPLPKLYPYKPLELE
jgi:GLPGLI family protein